jgi:acetyl esterase/lipase
MRKRQFGFLQKTVLLFFVGLLFAASAVTKIQAQAAPATLEPSEKVYRKLGDHELHAYVFRQNATLTDHERSAILLFHGGGWSEGSAEWVYDAARRFAGHGMVAIPIEYRLADGSVTPIESLADVCAAFRWARSQARELGLDPKRVAGYGVSAGGHLLASTVTVGCPADAKQPSPEPNAMLLLSPALDVGRDGWFREILKGRATPADYSPVEHVGATSVPTCIVQGAEDTLTPLASAKRYCDQVAKLKVACELNVFPNLGHLLTRNLKNQESEYDPDPEARNAGNLKQLQFLQDLGFIERR